MLITMPHEALSGSLKVGSPDSEPQKPYHTLVLSANANETGVALTATEDNTEAILVRILGILRLVISLKFVYRLLANRWTKKYSSTGRS